ncbi:MBL fold metallo-hydrolase [Deinococcus sp. 23YEL01]|uniref:MBL fold metallo-hydrolase n=1 Tax=Deinococcus sp. 23YEL01 TaxID=2745871 RepID=UPI001E3F17E6|nr:MBL fold metallo-hydrolase [Deinococcus sp. 23YEL01]MCD0168142.1 MBL fold metallo-hydrolase [Deinococcus sp. 23YEL01]
MSTDRFLPKTVSVRMYRNGEVAPNGALGGLGDCFLLAFPRPDTPPCYVLIDCGLFQGSTDTSKRLQRTMKLIGEATGEHLDAVVLTHQHYDHLSGFKLAWSTFETFTVDEVWLAWTEDPSDPLATQLRSRRDRQVDALRQIGQALHLHLRKASAALDPRQLKRDEAFGAQLEALLSFSDPVNDGKKSMPLAGVMQAVGQRGRVRYFKPGDTFVVGDSVTLGYVLGPPKNLSDLRRSDPSADGSEVYLDSPLRALVHTAAPDETTPAGEENQREAELPFGPHQLERRIDHLYPSYGDQQRRWRRVDTDWYQAAGPLALQLDRDTNNTSLVLAFELPHSGEVLLFPGDAQIGNWLSWDKVQFTVPTSTGQRTVTAVDLLRQTVLYKVGHHGSHNATLRERGLERMTHPDLVAMIPVDGKFAQQTKHWEMPYGDLYARLLTRTSGRVLRADQDVDLSKIAFPGQVTQHQDFVEYSLPGGPTPPPSTRRTRRDSTK